MKRQDPAPDIVPDSMEHLQIELDAIEKDAKIKVYPYGAITVNEDGKELSDMENIADKIVPDFSGLPQIMADAVRSSGEAAALSAMQ